MSEVGLDGSDGASWLRSSCCSVFVVGRVAVDAVYDSTSRLPSSQSAENNQQKI